MKDRIILILLIVTLWVFLVLFEVYLPFVPSTLIILTFMVVYCLILAIAQQFYRFKGPEETDKKYIETYKPHVNIFIPAHNEELVLKGTIENLCKIDYPNYDILIIDDRSQDKTAEVAKKLSENYPGKVRCHSRPDDAFPGKSAVLNDAFEMTEGEIICVFDADARVEPDFLTRIIPYMASDDIYAAQARKMMSNKNCNWLTRCQQYEYSMDANIQLGRDRVKGAVELRGNGELVKRHAIKAVGGWNIYTLTDDLDISTKLHVENFTVRFCPDVLVYEEAIESFKPIIKQRKRWAEGSIRRYLDYLKDILISKKISFRTTLDIIAYFSEFVLPIWLISDFVIQFVLFLIGGKPDIMANLIVISAIALFFISLLFTSILKFERCGIINAFKGAVMTAIFVIILWTIVVTCVVIKIVFKKRDMKWYKPARVGN